MFFWASSRVTPVATQPRRSGEKAEKLSPAFSTTIKNRCMLTIVNSSGWTHDAAQGSQVIALLSRGNAGSSTNVETSCSRSRTSSSPRSSCRTRRSSFSRSLRSPVLRRKSGSISGGRRTIGWAGSRLSCSWRMSRHPSSGSSWLAGYRRGITRRFRPGVTGLGRVRNGRPSLPSRDRWRSS